MEELQRLRDMLTRAVRPEDVFGAVQAGSDVAEAVKRAYRLLARVAHADRYQDEASKKIANEAMTRLNVLHAEAERRIAARVYGAVAPTPLKEQESRPVFKVGGATYTILRRVQQGGTAGIFEAIMQERTGDPVRVMLKVPHSAKDNDLMEREALALTEMIRGASPFTDDDEGKNIRAGFLSRLPRFVRSIRLRIDGGAARVVNVCTYYPKIEDGWASLVDMHRLYPKGIDGRVMVFVWNRQLEALMYAHRVGFLHRAVTPNHQLIHESHMGQLIDWTASCRIGSGDSVPYHDSAYAAYFPDELLSGGSSSPMSDIYMSAMCMVYLLGGSPEEKSIPATVERPIRELLNCCVQPVRKKRPQRVTDVYDELKRIAKDLYGPRKFVPIRLFATS